MFVVAPTLTLSMQLPSLIVSEPLVFKELLDLVRVFRGLKQGNKSLYVFLEGFGCHKQV